MPYLFIVLGAVLWGTIGLYVRYLNDLGFTPLQVVAVRVIAAGVILILYTYLTDRDKLKIRLSDIKYFIGTGVLSIVFFNWCYFTAIKEISLSVAVVLLYTAPAFVAVLSRFVFGELFTKRKVLSLLIILLGCALIVGLLPLSRMSLSVKGLLIGLGSGLGYALYSIFGKLASKKYSSLTITTYTFIFASLVMLHFGGLYEKKDLLFTPQVMAVAFGLGLIPTALAYILYTRGLSAVETGRAAIVANVEPVAAMFIGIGIYKEVLTGWQVLGSLLILTAAVLVQKKDKSVHAEDL